LSIERVSAFPYFAATCRGISTNAAALHRLRRLANAILHLEPEKDEGLPKIEPIQLEKEIVSLLLVLRALIEGAPQWRTR
jgi:hypothetical protein